MDTRARNRKVVIQQPSATQDEAGQPLNTWADVATVYANIRYLNGVETIKADAETSLARVSVRIGWRSGLTAAMRVLHGATIYRVESVLPDVVARRHVDLVCEVVS